MANIPEKLTDNLLNVYTYSFVETVPYEFFKPNPERDIAVNLVDKEYHCEKCGKVTHVNYQKRPLVYYSKGKLALERKAYDKLGKHFPYMGELEDGVPFTNEAIGLCTECAAGEVLQAKAPEQQVVNLAAELHAADELVVAKAQSAMEKALKSWLAKTDADEFLKYNLGDFAAVRDLICAVMLDDLAGVTAVLDEYLAERNKKTLSIKSLLEKLPEVWRAYAERPLSVFESMHDKMYHEYSVMFIEPGQSLEDYYIYRPIEKKRVIMFIEQPRIDTVEELLTEVGFHGEWIDLVSERLKELGAI